MKELQKNIEEGKGIRFGLGGKKVELLILLHLMNYGEHQ